MKSGTNEWSQRAAPKPTWLHDYTTTWLHDYTTTWLHNYMTTWLHDYKSTKLLHDYKTKGLQDYQMRHRQFRECLWNKSTFEKQAVEKQMCIWVTNVHLRNKQQIPVYIFSPLSRDCGICFIYGTKELSERVTPLSWGKEWHQKGNLERQITVRKGTCNY